MEPLTEQEVLQVIRQLLLPSVPERTAAIETLVGHHDDRGIGPITRRLFDSSASVRGRAMQALQEFGLGESSQLVTSLYDRSRASDGNLIPAIRDSLVELFVDGANPRGAHHAAIVAGQLRLVSVLPDVLPAAAARDVFLRRAIAETVWLFSVAEAVPLAFLQSVDVDDIVRIYSAHSLAEAEEFSMETWLTGSQSKKVRKESIAAFGTSGERATPVDAYRVPPSAMVITDPLYVDDKPVPIRATEILPLVDPMIGDSRPYRDLAGVMALVRTGDTRASDTLHGLASRSQAAGRALQLHFGERAVLPTTVSRRLTRPPGSDLETPSRTRRARREPTQLTTSGVAHPDLLRPFPPAKVLVIGGDGVGALYARRLSPLGLEVQWQSGFGDLGRIEHRLEGTDAAVLVWECMSHAAFNKARAALERLPAVKVGYSRSRGVVAVAQTIRALLTPA